MRDDVNSAPRLDSIESLRGVAALLIVMYHLVELLALPTPSVLNVIRTHFGLGVPLFYVLSGFVLAWGCADRLAGGRDQIVAFYVRRFFRIAPLFYAVLILWRGAGALLWSWSTPSQALALNVFFLFGLVPGEHESLVMAGWSIGVEMLFYLAFPVLLVFLRGVITTAAGFLLACVLSAAVYNSFETIGQGAYGYMNLFTQLPFFIAGMLCYQIWRTRSFERGPIGRWCLALAAIMVVLLVQSSLLQNILRDMRFGAMSRNVWALVFGILIYGACAASPLLLERGPLRWFGRLSFSIYLLHPIVMVFMIKQGMATWLIGLGHWQGFLVGSLIALGIIVCLSYVSHKWIELPGIAMGNRLLANGIFATNPTTLSIPSVNMKNQPLAVKQAGLLQQILKVLDKWFSKLLSRH
jgi:peptidoglycan/LPS O-acetylase OafA/YrhL